MEEEGDGLPVYVEEEDAEAAAAKEARAMRKAGGEWSLDKIRERFAEELAKQPPIPSPCIHRVDPELESPAGAMRHLAVSLKGPQLVSSANIVSVKVVKSAIGYPLLVYGTIFVRDELDCKHICVFRRGPDTCHRINSMAETLPLTDPSRGLVVFKNLHFEIDLKCKDHDEKERELATWFVTDSALTSTSNVIRNRFVGNQFTIDLTYAPAHRAVELTIDVKLCMFRKYVKRPTGFVAEEWHPFSNKKKECSEFHGKLSARVHGVPHDIVLYDSEAAGCVTRVGDEGRPQLFRRLLALPIDKKVSFQIASRRDGGAPYVMDYYPNITGCFPPQICVGSYMLEFNLVWSALYSPDVDGPHRSLALRYV